MFDFARLQGTGDLPRVLEGYYGSQAAVLANTPLTLLADAPEELVRGLPEIFLLKSERDLSLIDESNDVFVERLRGDRGRRSGTR